MLLLLIHVWTQLRDGLRIIPLATTPKTASSFSLWSSCWDFSWSLIHRFPRIPKFFYLQSTSYEWRNLNVKILSNVFPWPKPRRNGSYKYELVEALTIISKWFKPPAAIEKFINQLNSSSLQINDRNMASSNHHKPSSIWFTTEVALVLFFVVISSAAPLMNKRQLVDESERNITEQILLGMELINRIDNMTALEARDSNQSVSKLLIAISLYYEHHSSH